MKKLVLLSIFSLVIYSLNAQSTYTVEGEISNKLDVNHAVFIYPPDDSGNEYVYDTVEIKNQRFHYTGVIGRPQMAEVTLIKLDGKDVALNIEKSSDDLNSNNNSAVIYLDGSIKILFDAKGEASCYGGGIEELVWREYQNVAKFQSDSVDQNSADFDFFKFYEKIIKEMIVRFPDSYVCVDLMDLFTQGSIQPNIVEPMYKALSERMKSSEKVQGWYGRLEEEKLAVSGTILAPVFSIRDVEGNLVTLEMYRGSYLLLDFWASWCAPCRAENPNVVSAYEKYKDSNFSILGISLDDDKEKWLKAISEDNLPWKQVCDYVENEGVVAELYDVFSIPANVLIDPDGYIVAKNLKGSALHETLKKLLK